MPQRHAKATRPSAYAEFLLCDRFPCSIPAGLSIGDLESFGNCEQKAPDNCINTYAGRGLLVF